MRVITACARDKELTRNPTRVQGLSECTIHTYTDMHSYAVYRELYMYYLTQLGLTESMNLLKRTFAEAVNSVMSEFFAEKENPGHKVEPKTEKRGR